MGLAEDTHYEPVERRWAGQQRVFCGLGTAGRAEKRLSKLLPREPGARAPVGSLCSTYTAPSEFTVASRGMQAPTGSAVDATGDTGSGQRPAGCQARGAGPGQVALMASAGRDRPSGVGTTAQARNSPAAERRLVAGSRARTSLASSLDLSFMPRAASLSLQVHGCQVEAKDMASYNKRVRVCGKRHRGSVPGRSRRTSVQRTLVTYWSAV